MEAADETLTKLRDWFSESATTRQAGIAEAERARDYYDGNQLTAEMVAALAQRGQPRVVDNRVRPKVNYIKGVERKTRTDPKAYPRTPQHEKDASAATDALRYICDAERFEDTAAEVLENLLIEGAGGVDVTYDDASDAIKVVYYPWNRIFWDPRSSKPDFSDARYVGGVVWMDESEVRAVWPDAADDAIAGAYERQAAATETYDDKPRFMWAQAERKRVRVMMTHWVERGVWWSATYTGGGFLVEPDVSRYVDEKGKPCCSMVLGSCYIDRDNDRYGIVRDMFDLQDEVNKRRSRALFLMSSNRVIAEQGAVADEDAARAELAKPDGWVTKAPGLELTVMPGVDLAQAQMVMLQEAKQSLEGQGPNSYLQGRQSQAASGRAIMASQQGGLTEVEGAVVERFRIWKKSVYEAIWNRVRQYWTAERWVRVTDDESNVRFVGLNQPVTVADRLGEMPPDQQAQAMARLGMMEGDPRLGQVISIRNDVASLEVDIVIDTSPDVVTLQQEQFGMLAELAKIPGLIPPDALVEASSLRNKDEILKRLRPPEGPDGQPVPPPPLPELIKAQAELEMKQQAAMMDAQLEQQRLAAQIEADRVRAQNDMEIARQKAANDMEIARQKAAFDAEIKAMQAQASAAATVAGAQPAAAG